MSLTVAARIAALDTALTGVTHIEWAELGAATAGTSTGTVSSKVAATAVTLESAVDIGAYVRKGIDVASPPQLSAAASSAGTIRFWRFTTASSGGTAKTFWNQLTSDAVLASGGQISLADAAIYEKLTPNP